MGTDTIEYDFSRHGLHDMVARAGSFLELMSSRRSVRDFAPDPVPAELIEAAIRTAATAPSGSSRQPWTFVMVGDPGTKTRIRIAIEQEERENRGGSRVPYSWRSAVEPLDTPSYKPYLEIVPWIVVLFEQRYAIGPDGTTTRKNFFVRESAGIAAGLLVAALHNMGLATLTHTPSPMSLLPRILERPENERPFALFPIGYPAAGCRVPALERKPLRDVLIRFPDGSAGR